MFWKNTGNKHKDPETKCASIVYLYITFLIIYY